MEILSNLKYDRNLHGSFHVNSGEVKTVPEDTLSMREIYNRFRNGEPLDVNHYDPFYSDNDYQDIDMDMLDPVEQMELIQKYNEIAKRHLDKLKKKDVENNEQLNIAD